MIKVKLLIGLAAMLGVLAVTSASAFAEFEANTAGATSGKAQLTKTGAVFTATPGAGAVECAELANGTWKIREKASKQGATKIGGHLNISGQFTKCIAAATFPATVNAGCEVQIEQTGTTGKTGTGGVTSNCVISIPAINCTDTIAAGAPNTGLKAVTFTNITAGLEVNASVTGITQTATAGCAEGGIKSGKEGAFEANTVAHLAKAK
jgi:hypothetical protein